MRALGVGLVHWAPLQPLVDDGLVDLVELEPQSTWEKVRVDGRWRYRPSEPLAERLHGWTGPTLLHGIGQPVGGVTPDPVEHLDLLRATVEALDPVWVSEHLSLNRVTGPDGPRETGFLLPPRQSPAGVRAAAGAITRYGAALGRPVAFETGTTYLAPRADELPDGAYLAAVAQTADCGILLDLHNLWCNERNGRDRVEDVLAALPLDRVWEMHLAGGDELDGYRLDAHSGRVHPDLLALAADVVPRLPALGALVFEILPDHVAAVGLDAVAEQLADLRTVWATRRVPAVEVRVPSCRGAGAVPVGGAELVELRAWEDALAAVLAGTPVPAGADRFADLADDPAVALYRGLTGDFRHAAAARCLRATTTALLLGLGGAATRALLDTCTAEAPPDAFPAVDAERLARRLLAHRAVWAHLPHVETVLAFEHALLRTVLFGETTELAWDVDPGPLLAALAEGRAPAVAPPVQRTLVRIGR